MSVPVIYLIRESPHGLSILPSTVSPKRPSDGQPSDDGLHELAAPRWHSTTVTSRLVVSYTTFSPLPLKGAVIFFCRHLLSPIACTFASGVSCAARTFLSCLLGTSDRPWHCFPAAKLRKVEHKTKKRVSFFCRDGVSSRSLTAKLRKKVVTESGFWKINAIWPKIKAKRGRLHRHTLSLVKERGSTKKRVTQN